MRLLVLGDIHSNLEALRAVVADARAQGFDRAVSVGDVVGYGPEPGACIAEVQSLGAGVVMGNHDQASVGALPMEGFNAYARAAVEWTAAALSPAETAFLKGLPFVLREEAFAVSHGTLHQPAAFRYLLTEADAVDSLAVLDRPVCFLGHSHLPVWARWRRDGRALEISQTPVAPVTPGQPILVNVGSVGQPRDGDARAAYCIYDTEKKEAVIHRVDYDYRETGRKILAAGLPEVLAQRLTIGR